MILALAGGVGGARLANGLCNILDGPDLIVVVNTGDDFEHLGFSISPDLDTVMYTLGGCNNKALGWGIAGETWNFMQALEGLGGETWFRLGDRDLATHTVRTQALREGRTLSEVTETLFRRLQIGCRVVPMSDDLVRTMVECEEGVLAFQEYFVRRRCEPVVKAIRYQGASEARPAEAFHAALQNEKLDGIVLCPSNPFLSVRPILAVAGVESMLRKVQAPVVAVSPIVAGAAVKGPAAKIMQELGMEVSSLGIARVYGDLIDGLIIDAQDAHLRGAIESLGIAVAVTDTIMRSDGDQQNLAAFALEFVSKLRGTKMP
jgi:LPPG:FO 2-phospho-L-lactate transferase